MNIRKIILGTCSALSIAAFGIDDVRAATSTGILPVSVTVQESCAFGASAPISFGNVNPGTTSAVDNVQGSLLLTCTGTQSGITIVLAPQNGNPSAPALSNGSSTIPYLFYTDSGYTIPYTGGTYATITAAGGGVGSTIPVYAQIASGTTIPNSVGTYSDPVVATATF